MPYSHILFDLDGTLFDYDAAENKAIKKTFEQMGLNYSADFLATYRQINGQLWKDFEEGLVTQDRLKIKRFSDLSAALEMHFDAKLFSELYLENLSRQTDMIDGTEKVLDALSRDKKLYLITNGLKKVQRPRVAGSSIAGYFDDLFISEEIGYAKPDENIFKYVFDKMGNPSKDHVLIVGDSLSSDMEGGIRFGIDTCWFNPQGKENPSKNSITYIIKTLSELLTLNL